MFSQLVCISLNTKCNGSSLVLVDFSRWALMNVAEHKYDRNIVRNPHVQLNIEHISIGWIHSWDDDNLITVAHTECKKLIWHLLLFPFTFGHRSSSLAKLLLWRNVNLLSSPLWIEKMWWQRPLYACTALNCRPSHSIEFYANKQFVTHSRPHSSLIIVVAWHTHTHNPIEAKWSFVKMCRKIPCTTHYGVRVHEGNGHIVNLCWESQSNSNQKRCWAVLGSHLIHTHNTINLMNFRWLMGIGGCWACVWNDCYLHTRLLTVSHSNAVDRFPLPSSRLVAHAKIISYSTMLWRVWTVFI